MRDELRGYSVASVACLHSRAASARYTLPDTDLQDGWDIENGRARSSDMEHDGWWVYNRRYSTLDKSGATVGSPQCMAGKPHIRPWNRHHRQQWQCAGRYD